MYKIGKRNKKNQKEADQNKKRKEKKHHDVGVLRFTEDMHIHTLFIC